MTRNKQDRTKRTDNATCQLKAKQKGDLNSVCKGKPCHVPVVVGPRARRSLKEHAQIVVE